MRLGQPAVEFWESTPRRVRAFFDAFTAGERAWDERFGVIAAVTVNVHRKKGSRALQPSEFFPSLAPARRARMSSAEMRAAMLAAFRGRTARRSGTRS